MIGDGSDPARHAVLHGSCVALGPAAVLIRGASGSGKSGLALQLMALGCVLVSDDQVVLERRDGALLARAPAGIRGMIEARGIGLLAAETVAEAVVRLVVDLDAPETERLPPERETAILGLALPLVRGQTTAHFAASLRQYLAGGRRA